MSNTFPFGNDPAKVGRYRAFWARDDVDRPLVGFSFKSWFPLEEYAASAAWQSVGYLTPDMVAPEAFMADQERLLREGEEIRDDILRGASPSQAVPWLCGMVGSRMRILPGSILGDEQSCDWDELVDLSLDRSSAWLESYIAFIDTLVETSAGRFPVSHGTLVGPSDIAAVLRGHGRFILDLLDSPELAAGLIERAGDVFLDVTEAAWSRIPLFHGGYYDAQYQLWAPGPIARLQEDASALYSPDLYRRFVQPVDRRLAEHFACCFMHLHSTSMFLMDLFLEIDALRCFEVNHDVSGPGLDVMIPYFQRIQQCERSLLVRGTFTEDEARLLVDSLDPRGLYIYCMVTTWDEIECIGPVLGLP